MKRVIVLCGDPVEMKKDLKKLFKFKVTRVREADILDHNGELLRNGVALEYKTNKRNYTKFLETRERYGY